MTIVVGFIGAVAVSVLIYLATLLLRGDE